MNIPEKLQEILKKDDISLGIVLKIVESFEPILKKSNMLFFEEYTDHGIEHIEMVLKVAEYLISEESFQYIQPKEVAILILVIILHDIGMYTEFPTFNALINGEYDKVKVESFDKKTWRELWEDYLSEVRHLSSKQKENIFGNPNEIINDPDLSNKNKLTEPDKKLIGEFIRRNHARLAHEIALKGFIGNEIIPFGNSNLDERDKQLVGVIARSHGVNIRDTYLYLKDIAQDAWKYPDGLNVIFFMVLLRIADYLHIDKSRTNKYLLKIKTFNSPNSLREHKIHLSIRHIDFGTQEPELIYVECNKPENPQMYVKIQNLIKDIQHEFDLSWAILGETYGFLPKEKPQIKFRRITSNLNHPTFLEQIDYVPKKISFEVNNEVAKLLVAPLYGDNPTFGVRELVQNATDACKERIKIENDNKNTDYTPFVTVSVDEISKEQYSFKIKDNGKGMTLDEIQNYFLSVGSSFRKTIEWKKEFEGKVSRNGRFGIGVLAAFLLGDKITVKTKSYKNGESAYEFSTDLCADFIDVKKISGFEIGTEIEIAMSEKIFHKLTSEKNIISWKDWYVGEIPEIQYLLCGNKQKPKWSFTPSKNFIPQSKEYGTIHWKYLKDWKDSLHILVVCNDIIITLSYPDHRFTVEDSSLSHGHYIIIDKPCIFIEDTQGMLPLKLDRTDLDTTKLPFEKDLLLDVSKDFIAQLLMAPISINGFSTPVFFPHKTEFLFLKTGFVFASDYFINRLNDSQHKYFFLDISIDNDSRESEYIPTLLNDLPEYVLNLRPLKTIDEIRGYDKTGIRLFRKGHEVHHSNWQYTNNYIIDVYNYFKNKSFDNKIVWEDDNFFIVKGISNQTKTDESTIKNLLSIMEKMNNKIITIEEIPFEEMIERSLKGGTILDNLLEKYFVKNFIIPYNMEERKVLFQLAFDELKDYIKDYERDSKSM